MKIKEPEKETGGGEEGNNPIHSYDIPEGWNRIEARPASTHGPVINEAKDFLFYNKLGPSNLYMMSYDLLRYYIRRIMRRKFVPCHLHSPTPPLGDKKNKKKTWTNIPIFSFQKICISHFNS